MSARTLRQSTLSSQRTLIDVASAVCTGGTTSEITDATTGKRYRLHLFTSGGTFTAPQDVTFEYIVVGGGGGGGGGSPSAVGGGGNFRNGIAKFSAGSYTVTIGGGGGGGASDTTGAAGGLSALGPILSYGGNGGAGYPRNGGVAGNNYSSAITGTSISYGVDGGGSTANRGNGGTSGGPGSPGGAGGSGFVAVRYEI